MREQDPTTRAELATTEPAAVGAEAIRAPAAAASHRGERPAAMVEAVYEAITDGILVVDLAGSIVFANDAMARFAGYPSARELRLAGTAHDDALRFELRTPAGGVLPVEEWPLSRVLRGEVVHERDLEVRRRDTGEIRWISYNAQPVRDARGAQVLAVIIARDITARVLSELALRESEEEARTRAAMVEAVLDCIADGVVVYDAQGRTILSSRAADEILGIPRGERAAPVAERVMRQYEVTTEDGRRLGPEEMIAVRAAIQGVTARGVINRVRTADQPPRWLMMSAVPLRLRGEHTGAVLSMTDVSERKAAEAELAVVTRLYAVLSRVNEAIVRTRDEQALYAEVCRIVAEDGGFPLVWVGLVRGDEIACAASAGTAAEYVRDLRVEVDGALGAGPTGTSVRDDRPVINDDFEVNPSTQPWREASLRFGLRASAAFPLHRDGRVVGAVTFYADRPGAFTPKQTGLLGSLCADLSFALDAMEQERRRTQAEQALRESEQSLREADRRKDEFLGMLSHELRNPLAPIRNSVHVLRHAEPGSAPALRARGVIERQVDHLSRLVDDLLDVTRIARGKIQLRRSRTDLRELVLRAADDFHAELDARRISFAVAVPAEKVWVDADPTRVAQVIGNLLHNAAKFSSHGASVTLSLRAGDGTAEIAVRDTGRGIDPLLLPHVFEPFVQGDRTLARSEGGLGLGLALVKGIVELHGGTVSAGSAGPGEGAEFSVRLPLSVTDAAAPHRDRAPGAQPGRRILVVDDHADAAESLAEVLRLGGHAVEVAADGLAALASARARPPDVVVCDIGLPGMSGLDVARVMRADAVLRQTRLIALSGYAQADDRERARAAGFDAHVAKPPDLDGLLALVASAAAPD